MKKINPAVGWWVTPKLPPEDVFAKHNFFTQWLIHPIKRRIARAHLVNLHRQGGIKVIGITGSTGKTTTTEILASILSLAGKTVWSAEGVDPVYNIPNTILRANIKTRYLILEMSVEYINEMDYYLWLVKPDIGIVTNVATTHTQYLKNNEGVANEKKKLVQALDKAGTAVLNGEDKIVSSFSVATIARVLYFGEGREVAASNIKLNKDLSTDFTLKINTNTKNIHISALGNQFVDNALAAASAANALGIGIDAIARGVEAFRPPKHRLNVFISKTNGIIFDDTYNSNPKAAYESLDTFEVLAEGKRKIAVIGDMLELGKFEEEAHRDLGKKAAKTDFECLIGVGSAARFIVDEASCKLGNKKCFLVGDYQEALELVKPILGKETALFVKGSRSIHLDRLVEALI